MSLVLASLYSNRTPGAGLMVYDINKSAARFVQLIDFSGIPVQLHQVRGISMAADRLYVVSPCAMLVFRITDRKSGLIFIHEKTICRPEWILGNNQQGDLHAVYASEEKQRVFLSFNAQSAIDIFDLDGNYLHRRNLWDIAPDLFSVPTEPTNKYFQYGLVRHIFINEQKETMLTVALLNGREDSAVINYDTGRLMLAKASEPMHGGLPHKNLLYLCAIRSGAVQAYAWTSKNGIEKAEPVREFVPRTSIDRWRSSDQKTRGLMIVDERLVCGVCYFRRPKRRQVPARMVEFDLNSGEQIREHWLPSFHEMKEPHIYAMLPVTGDLEQAILLRHEPQFYQGESPISPIWTAPGDLIEAGNNASDSHGSQTGISDTSQSEAIFSFESGPDIEAESSSGVNAPDSPTVVFENVGLCYQRAARKFLSFNKNLRQKKSFWALRDVSFAVLEGETLGVIGRNGSGKSTLSMICSGVLVPDTGNVSINGRTQLLALGVGFKLELSGRENVFISSSLLGLSKKEINSRMDEIEEFAELGEFMDEPVRTYSSGMRSRLGFAVATAVKPEILILDEIMSTGDKAFRAKAMKRMRDMRGLARSVIVVSHNSGQLRKLSTRVLWLEKGRMIMLGEPKQVLNAYDNFCKNPAKWFKNNPEFAEKIHSNENLGI